LPSIIGKHGVQIAISVEIVQGHAKSRSIFRGGANIRAGEPAGPVVQAAATALAKIRKHDIQMSVAVEIAQSHTVSII
jgi:hypothetical protein